MDHVEFAWKQQKRWSHAAGTLKKSISRARWTTLALSVVGAVLATASAQLFAVDGPTGRGLAVAAAVALAVIPFTQRGMSVTKTRDWTRARSVSEAIKADVHLFLARATPFRGAERDTVLLSRLDTLADDAGDLARYLPDPPERRALPAVHDVESYAEVRVREQAERYYRPKAHKIGRAQRILSAAETSLAVIAATLVAVAAIVPSPKAIVWIGVLTTVAGALAAHSGAARYDYQFVEFTRTADKLERLLAQRSVDAVDDDTFVVECERVISIQNEGWMAKMALDEADPAPAN
ncbi:Integral membrane protein [Alloactinosynnema sp. L-07]|uniref:DUF4231 domain-containing protein n=1 Tax=Alloactinosynnema sp. L-07 TaxID=1653480 RepID=UPI00065EFCD4|nr:DUF4231 domain-containing protein [Alloactinosynnema sp. L-07]CRK59402.1 Integral membrane protein [Alloactinosynnema sp. L-07]